jgi:hypothetical protein
VLLETPKQGRTMKVNPDRFTDGKGIFEITCGEKSAEYFVMRIAGIPGGFDFVINEIAEQYTPIYFVKIRSDNFGGIEKISDICSCEAGKRGVKCKHTAAIRQLVNQGIL